MCLCKYAALRVLDSLFHYKVNDLVHWGRDKVDAISQTTFSNAISGIKMYEFRIKFHWRLFTDAYIRHSASFPVVKIVPPMNTSDCFSNLTIMIHVSYSITSCQVCGNWNGHENRRYSIILTFPHNVLQNASDIAYKTMWGVCGCIVYESYLWRSYIARGTALVAMVLFLTPTYRYFYPTAQPGGLSTRCGGDI